MKLYRFCMDSGKYCKVPVAVHRVDTVESSPNRCPRNNLTPRSRVQNDAKIASYRTPLPRIVGEEWILGPVPSDLSSLLIEVRRMVTSHLTSFSLKGSTKWSFEYKVSRYDSHSFSLDITVVSG